MNELFYFIFVLCKKNTGTMILLVHRHWILLNLHKFDLTESHLFRNKLFLVYYCTNFSYKSAVRCSLLGSRWYSMWKNCCGYKKIL